MSWGTVVVARDDSQVLGTVLDMAGFKFRSLWSLCCVRLTCAHRT